MAEPWYAWERSPVRHILTIWSATLNNRLQANLAAVHDRIRRAAQKSGRNPDEIRLIAVTKTVPALTARALFDLGHRDLAENRVQTALTKLEEVGPGPVWHWIGHLQSNKVRKVVGRFAWIHSVHSLELLERIERVATETGTSTTRVLLQVNVTGEDVKSGLAPEDVAGTLSRAAELGSVEVMGLMTMAKLDADPERARPAFRALRLLRDEADRAGWYRAPLSDLSMGMSGDLEIAVEEGATLVRVGSALFASE